MMPSDTETSEFLKKLGVKQSTINKSSLGRRAVPRPCFHPSGRMLLTAGGATGLKLTTIGGAPLDFSLEGKLSKHWVSKDVQAVQNQMS